MSLRCMLWMYVTALVDIQANFKNYVILWPLKEDINYRGMIFYPVMGWKYSHGMTIFYGTTALSRKDA